MRVDLKRIVSFVGAIIITVSLLGTPQPAAAGSYITVNFYDDIIKEDGLCSLREAIIATNENRAFGGCSAGNIRSMDYIYLPARPFALRLQGGLEDSAYSGDLDITDSLTIMGAGSGTNVTVIFADPTVVDFNHRIFHIRAGTSKKVVLSNLKIYNGNASAVNELAVGGGILNDKSDLTINRVILIANKSNDTGGGIANSRYSLLKIESSQFDSNWAKDGGGLFNQGRVEVWNSLFISNTGNGSGGGMKNNVLDPATDWAIVRNSTFTQNISTNGGAGIYNDGKLYLQNVTIYNNQGTGLMTSGNGWIQNSIISNHPAGIPGQSTGGNCLFLENGDGFVSQGSNIGSNPEDAAQCNLKAWNDIIGQDPGIDGLVDDGGPTRVLRLKAGSIAIDRGVNAACNATDQRLMPRPIDGDANGAADCDIGAYEFGSSLIFNYLPVLNR